MMKSRFYVSVVVGALALGGCASSSFAQTIAAPPGESGGDAGLSGAIEQKPLLTAAQRSAIYAEVSADKSKSSPKQFSAVIGADVPPMIELYALPDDVVADIPAAKVYRYTMVENKVVVVDPTRMRVIDVIGPAQKP